MRAPTGHGDIRGNNDVELKSTLLSHPLAPSTVVAMPVSSTSLPAETFEESGKKV